MKNNKFILFFFLFVFVIIPSCKKVEKVMNVSTGVVTNITSTTANVSGSILDLGNGVTQHGHCFAITPNPTISGSKTELGVPSGVGVFKSNLTGLEPESKYYIKAYCSRGKETVYGSEINFTTGATSPTAAVTTATSITNTSAIINGTVNANGNSATVTFEYGTSILYGNTATVPSPVTGTSTTNVSASLTGLTPGVTYHFRIKAVCTDGTIYSNDLSFTTSQLPTATTGVATSLTNITAILNGTVNANNLLPITVIFEYGTSGIYGSTATATPNSVTGGNPTTVNALITGLKSGQTYHFRVNAVSSAGTVNGDDVTFTTLVKDGDGHDYSIVTIGTQVWIKENLKTIKLSDGASLIKATESTWASGGACYGWYNDSIKYQNIYGALYNWAAVQLEHLCPTGWHVPTDIEWTTLTDFLTNNYYGYEHSGNDIAKSIAATSGWTSSLTAGRVGNDQASNNSSGFTALPGGQLFTGPMSPTYYKDSGTAGYWWSSTINPDVTVFPIYRYITSSSSSVSTGYSMGSALSVRCVRDN
jgi:uncharacterized protein (TIGR02145 family)